jgi:peptidoglycan/LPS O-acetylase OafA/YrhL
MAMTRDRLQAVEEREELQELEELYQASPDVEPPRGDALTDWCRRLLFGWLAVIGSIIVFEPAPSNPNAAVPAWGNVLLVAFFVALAAALAGLSRRRPWALRASVVAGGLGIAVGAACALTDHHVGFWSAYEIAAFSGLAAASWFSMRTST